jgi:hypothetical protein
LRKCSKNYYISRHVKIYCLMPNEQFVSNSMERWCPFYTKPSRLAGYFIVLAHRNNNPPIDMSRHFTYHPDSEPPVFALNLLRCVVSREAANTNFIVFGLTRQELTLVIFHKTNMLTITPSMLFVDYWCLIPFSTMFQIYWWRIQGVSKKYDF